MRILIISDAWHPQLNGVVRTYEHLCTALEARGHTTHVIGPNDFARQISLLGYDEIKIPLAPYKKLSHMIKDFAPDSIHIATEGTLGWAARKYCLQRGIKFTTCYHTHFPDYVAKRAVKFLPFMYKSIYKASHRAARAFVHKFHKPSSCVFVATDSLERTLKRWGFSMPMARLVRGVDIDIFHPANPNHAHNDTPRGIAAKTLSKALNDIKRPIALYVGRIATEKNLDAFLDMRWAGTKVLIGDGPDLTRLRKANDPAVIFAGTQTGAALADYYRAADIFVFPSKTDTFGLVLIEALACGIPVAAYPVTGPIDIITNDILGALNTDLAIAAQQALTRAKSGAQATRFEHITKNYTWPTVALQFENAIHTSENT